MVVITRDTPRNTSRCVVAQAVKASCNDMRQIKVSIDKSTLYLAAFDLSVSCPVHMGERLRRIRTASKI